MSATKLALIAFYVVAGVFVVTWLVFAFWRVRSQMKRRAAGEAPLTSRRAVIWRDPGPAESLDLAAGPGGRDGAPVPPFQFVEEHGTGSFPCVSVRDARGRAWRVKWGNEVHTETFAARLAWAAGYFVEVNYFVPSGRIEGAGTLQRAGEYIAQDGSFQNARFELDEPGVVKHFDEHSWAWNDNPFVGTRELNGLKIVMMLLSNWDNKDVRDVARGIEHGHLRVSDGARRARGAVSHHRLGRGARHLGQQRAEPRPLGLRRVRGAERSVRARHSTADHVLWGYKGQRTADAVMGISRSDVHWLYKYLGRLTDDQLAAGLRASGGTETEIADFTTALRARLDRLKDVTVSAACS